MSVMKYKAVVFDLDGTLYDNSVLRRMLPIYNIGNIGLIMAERSVRKSLAGSWLGSREEVFRAMFRMISSRTGVPAKKVEQWYKGSYMPSMTAIVRKFCHKRYWVDELLSDLKCSGCKTACFSDYDFVDEKLRALQIDPASFDLIIDAAQTGGLKPCCKSFATVADKLGVSAEDVLVVGDREDTDGRGASGAGMHFLKIPEDLNILLNLI